MSAAPSENRQHLKCNQEALERVLDQLDHPGDGTTAGKNKRSEVRHQYRVHDVTIELRSPHAPNRRYAVATRNLSARGVSFIVPHFVYPGTICHAMLVTLQHHLAEHTGVVTRCAYITGGGGLHEVGVRFDAPIDLSMFQRSLPLQILVADADPAVARRAAQLLQDQCGRLKHASDDTDAAHCATVEQFDLALLDLGLPGQGGLGLARELRTRGLAIPLAALVERLDDERRNACTVAGFDYVIAKPLSRNALLALVQTVRVEPLFSALAKDAGQAAAIDEFVGGLPARLAKIQTALAQDDHAGLKRMVEELRLDATDAGFDPLAESAHAIEAALHAGHDALQLRPLATLLMRNSRAARGVSCVALTQDAPPIASNSATPQVATQA